MASDYQSTAFVLSGTNVYTIDDVGGTNAPIPASLLGTFMKRVQPSTSTTRTRRRGAGSAASAPEDRPP